MPRQLWQDQHRRCKSIMFTMYVNNDGDADRCHSTFTLVHAESTLSLGLLLGGLSTQADVVVRWGESPPPTVLAPERSAQSCGHAATALLPFASDIAENIDHRERTKSRGKSRTPSIASVKSASEHNTPK